jgi:MFS transporter, ACS family, D-galactonate transporter
MSPAAQDENAAPVSDSGMNRILFLLGLSVFLNYIDRSNLSIAAPLIKDELGISAAQLGTLLSAFFYTYALLQIPAGWLVDRFDVKWVFAAGFFVWSAATAVTGLLHGFVALFLMRIVLGVGESIAFPACSKIVAEHFHQSRRGRANSVVISGLALGPAAGMLIGGSVVGRFGWRPFFLTLGLAGLLWLLPWWGWMPRRVAHSEITKSNDAGLVPILLHRSAWGSCLGQFSINYYIYFLLTWLPFYLVRERNLSMDAMAWRSALVFLMYAVGAAICGQLTDRWRSQGASDTLAYKTSMGVGLGGTAVCLVLTALSSAQLLPWMLALTGLFIGIGACHSWTIAQTLAGRQMVGRWSGLQNFVGNCSGAVAPMLTGILLDRTGSFLWPFFITAVVAAIGALGWTLVVGPIEEVDWMRIAPRRT